MKKRITVKQMKGGGYIIIKVVSPEDIAFFMF